MAKIVNESRDNARVGGPDWCVLRIKACLWAWRGQRETRALDHDSTVRTGASSAIDIRFGFVMLVLSLAAIFWTYTTHTTAVSRM